MAELNEYQKTAVTTATAMELVLMVYDECIRSLERAEAAFKMDSPDRIEIIGNNLLRAQDTITELSLSLDLDRGGEISENLSRLYDFMTHHLSQANIRQELKPIQEVKLLMMDLREAWATVAAQEPPVEENKDMMLGSRTGRIRIAG